ncbi:unnamed protein product [Arctia plantaginis]|uniref:Protein rolling stone n=1 Tax=Arctia plantaginis TaxID=874455 RepID=A0A8S1BBY6_ARCPL|nr:unnamed protein product [Arctia plantaginis]
MDRVKKYFKKEFTVDMLSLGHDSASDFYLSSWQRNRSAIPLLFIRTIIFVGCVSILISSMVITSRVLTFGTWFIFLTHWGLVLNTVACGQAFVVSVIAFSRGPIDASLGLPWYVKIYWAFYNISIPIALFISIFYFAMLTDLSDTFGMNPVLDVFIHLVNSLLMLILVAVSRHPTRLLHFYWSLGAAFIYMIFTVIFHFAGGISPFGESWIYPMINWSNPGPTIGVVMGSAVGLIILHAILVGITVTRKKLTLRFGQTNSFNTVN